MDVKKILDRLAASQAIEMAGPLPAVPRNKESEESKDQELTGAEFPRLRFVDLHRLMVAKSLCEVTCHMTCPDSRDHAWNSGTTASYRFLCANRIRDAGDARLCH